MYYLDSSAIVKIYIQEPGSDWIQALRRRSINVEIPICEISGAEVFAAFYRRYRCGELPIDILQNACDLFSKRL